MLDIHHKWFHLGTEIFPGMHQELLETAGNEKAYNKDNFVALCGKLICRALVGQWSHYSIHYSLCRV